MRNRLYTFFLCLIALFAGCTRGLWLDEIVAQRDEQEEVVPILRAAQENGLTVDSAEEIERTNKYYTVDTANGYYNEFKRYRLVFSDQTTVEFDVLGQLNGVQCDYYTERGLSYISSIDLSDIAGNLYIWLAGPDSIGGTLSFPYTTPNGGGNTPENKKIYYTSTDGEIVTPYDTNAFGANIVSNTYENGQGVITFDGEVMEIGGSAFQECSTLSSINIPDSVSSIGEYAFAGSTSLTSATIPEGVSSIGKCAFYGCSSLASITIPVGVRSLGNWAFYNCLSLVSITIRSSVTSIGKFAFSACTSLASITIPEGVTSIGEGTFSGCSSLASVTIPEGVTSIDSWAFEKCSSLVSITIPEEVTWVGSSAFTDCTSLASVYCKPKTPPTTNVSQPPFDNNASGRKIYVPEESVEAYKTAEWWSEYADAFVPYDFENGEVENLESRKIYYTSTDGNVVTPYSTGVFGANIVSNTYENGQGVITFDGEVTKIGDNAFFGCSRLASITIPDSVTLIGFYAFMACSSLASITIPDGVTWIGNQTFEGCRSLASITIPDSVTSIGSRAFYDCSSLASISIPDSVTSIGRYTFYACLSLVEVYSKPTTPPRGGDYIFDNNASDRKIYVPEESVEAYKTAEYWSNYAADIVGYDFENGEMVEEEIPETWKIYYTSTDGEIIEPYHKTCVGQGQIVTNTYENGQGIIVLDREIGDISDDFQNCQTLKTITIPDNVSIIGGWAFRNCTSLESFTISENIVLIGDRAFENCSSLTSVTLPNNVTTLGVSVFSKCQSLNSVTIGSGITFIANNAFYQCGNLASVVLSNNVEKIGDYAFYECTQLSQIEFPSNLKTIGLDSFGYCANIESITLPQSITTIGGCAFRGCTRLQSIYCQPITPPTAEGSIMFDNNASGRKIYVPAESVEAYKAAKRWSDYAADIVGYSF